MRLRKTRDPHSIASHYARTKKGIIGAWYATSFRQWHAYWLTNDMRDVVGRALAAAPTQAELIRRLEAHQ